MPLTSSKKGVRTPKRGHLLNILGRPGWGIGTGRCPCPNFAQITHTHTSLHSSNSCSRFPFWKGRENCRNHAPKFSTPKSVCLPSSSGPVAIAHFPYSTDTPHRTGHRRTAAAPCPTATVPVDGWCCPHQTAGERIPPPPRC